MTAMPAPVADLLVELARRGIELRAVGDRLRYRPRAAMTPDLADRLTAHRGDLLATYTPEERRRLADGPSATLAAIEAAKEAFAQVGSVTVEAVRPFKSAARDEAARLIRDARRGGDVGRAVALRDAWRERLAICTMDGDLPLRDAERVALDELGSMLAQRQG